MMRRGRVATSSHSRPSDQSRRGTDFQKPNADAIRELASQLLAECKNVQHPSTAGQRQIRRKYSKLVRNWPDASILQLARILCERNDERWLAYEIVLDHDVFRTVGQRHLEQLGKGVDSWWTVDAFARTLTGPAWLNGRISERVIQRWAASPDYWWRRVALVSTVALNMRSHGGTGDTRRTLDICGRLIEDHTDMVVKGMSWALRALVVFDPDAVRRFLAQHRDRLHPRVIREVSNKLNIGLKNPRRARTNN